MYFCTRITSKLILALIYSAFISSSLCALTDSVSSDESRTSSETSEETTESLRTLSLIWGAFSTEIIQRVPTTENKILQFYTAQLTAKTECQWTDQDKSKWQSKLGLFQEEAKNETKLDDYLGLDEYRNRQDLKESAKLILGVLEDMENWTKSYVLSEWSDYVILKYAGYLREKIIRRQVKFPSCTWTSEEQERGRKMITEIIAVMANEAVDGTVARLNFKEGGDIFTEEDKKDLKKEFESLAKVYGSFFEDFEQD